MSVVLMIVGILLLMLGDGFISRLSGMIIVSALVAHSWGYI